MMTITLLVLTEAMSIVLQLISSSTTSNNSTALPLT